MSPRSFHALPQEGPKEVQLLPESCLNDDILYDSYTVTSFLQAPHTDVTDILKHLGLEKGWGKTVGRIREIMSLLLDILQAPDPDILEDFLGRLPVMNKVVILSPHGFFGQKDVLGKPDTGGQVMQFQRQACFSQLYHTLSQSIF